MNTIWVIANHTIKALIRKKDFYVFCMMLLILLGFLFSERFFGVSDISRYLKDIGFFFVWTFSMLIAITFSAKQLPEEIETRTIYPLLAKPVSRIELIAGRFFGAVSASCLSYTVFYLPYILAAYLKGGAITLPLIFQTYILTVCFLFMVCAVTITLSLWCTVSAAITLSIILHFFVIWFADELRMVINSMAGVSAAILTGFYYMLPHYEFCDMRVRVAHSWEPLPIGVFISVVLYAGIYTGIILFAGHKKLKKKVL